MTPVRYLPVVPESGVRLIETHAVERPWTRGDCIDMPRPCPFVSCRHHLYLDVTKHGRLQLNFPGVEVEDLIHSCALDVADDGDHTLEEVGVAMNVTRERVRQMEEAGLRTFRRRAGL